MKKRNIAMIVVLGLLTLSLTGCKVAKLENGQDAAVKIDKGLGISADDLYKGMKEKYGASAILELIDINVLGKEFPETEEEVKYIDEQISSLIASFGSEQALLKQSESSYGISTMEGLKAHYSLIYKRREATKAYIIDQITDEEIEEYYETRVFGDTTASHILITPKAGTTDEETTKNQEAAKKEAAELIKKLNNGEDFAKLAKENSDDQGSAEDGGALGEFSFGTMVDSFEQALIKLKVGEYSKEPVASSFGYHIILKEKENKKPALKDAKEDIIEKIYVATFNNDTSIELEALESYRNKYNVKFEDDELKKYFDHYMNSLKDSLK